MREPPGRGSVWGIIKPGIYGCIATDSVWTAKEGDIPDGAVISALRFTQLRFRHHMEQAQREEFARQALEAKRQEQLEEERRLREARVARQHQPASSWDRQLRKLAKLDDDDDDISLDRKHSTPEVELRVPPAVMAEALRVEAEWAAECAPNGYHWDGWARADSQWGFRLADKPWWRIKWAREHTRWGCL